MICAGTNAGKTYVAFHVIESHLLKNPKGMFINAKHNTWVEEGLFLMILNIKKNYICTDQSQMI